MGLITNQSFVSRVLCIHSQNMLLSHVYEISCERGDIICLYPCTLTISSHLFARWHLFRHVGYLRHQQQVDLWPFDLEGGVKSLPLCQF